MNERHYPIRVPDEEDDPRFTIGFALDVAEVLERHGYPGFTSGNVMDLVELQQALFRFIYCSADGTGS